MQEGQNSVSIISDSFLPANTLSLAAVGRLHPAQVALGYREVEYRAQRFKAMTATELDAYLQENFLPIVTQKIGNKKHETRHMNFISTVAATATGEIPHPQPQ